MCPGQQNPFVRIDMLPETRTKTSVLHSNANLATQNMS